jgi:hypothetical protein
MKYIKIAVLAGALASVSSFAFAQAGAPTVGVDFSSVYAQNTTANGSYAQAGQHVRARAVRNTANRQSGSSITTGSGVGSPD